MTKGFRPYLTQHWILFNKAGFFFVFVGLLDLYYKDFSCLSLIHVLSDAFIFAKDFFWCYSYLFLAHYTVKVLKLMFEAPKVLGHKF